MLQNEKYKLEKIKSASDLEALIIIYYEILERLGNAKKLFNEKESKMCEEEIGWIFKAVDGLISLLNFEVEPALALNLYRVYEYLSRRLMVAKAGIRQTPDILCECALIVSSIRDAWSESKEKGGDVTEKFKVSSTSEERNFLNIEV